MCVNNLLSLLTDTGTAGSWTRRSQIKCPIHYNTGPHKLLHGSYKRTVHLTSLTDTVRLKSTLSSSFVSSCFTSNFFVTIWLSRWSLHKNILSTTIYTKYSVTNVHASLLIAFFSGEPQQVPSQLPLVPPKKHTHYMGPSVVASNHSREIQDIVRAVLLHTCPCWKQVACLDWGDDSMSSPQ